LPPTVGYSTAADSAESNIYECPEYLHNEQQDGATCKTSSVNNSCFPDKYVATDDNSGMASAEEEDEEEEEEVYDIQTVAEARNRPAEVEQFDDIYEQPTQNVPDVQTDVEAPMPETDYEIPSPSTLSYMPSTVQHNNDCVPPAKAQKNAVNTKKVSCVIVGC
jgi:hypothetical protein